MDKCKFKLQLAFSYTFTFVVNSLKPQHVFNYSFVMLSKLCLLHESQLTTLTNLKKDVCVTYMLKYLYVYQDYFSNVIFADIVKRIEILKCAWLAKILLYILWNITDFFHKSTVFLGGFLCYRKLFDSECEVLQENSRLVLSYLRNCRSH